MGAVKRMTAKIMSREKSTFKIYCHCDVVCTFTLYMPNTNRANQKQNRSKHQNTVYRHPMNQNKHQANSSKANAIKIKCTLIGLLNDWYIIHCEWHARANRELPLPSTRSSSYTLRSKSQRVQNYCQTNRIDDDHVH